MVDSVGAAGRHNQVDNSRQNNNSDAKMPEKSDNQNQNQNQNQSSGTSDKAAKNVMPVENNELQGKAAENRTESAKTEDAGGNRPQEGQPKTDQAAKNVVPVENSELQDKATENRAASAKSEDAGGNRPREGQQNSDEAAKNVIPVENDELQDKATENKTGKPVTANGDEAKAPATPAAPANAAANADGDEAKVTAVKSELASETQAKAAAPAADGDEAKAPATPATPANAASEGDGDEAKAPATAATPANATAEADGDEAKAPATPATPANATAEADGDEAKAPATPATSANAAANADGDEAAKAGAGQDVADMTAEERADKRQARVDTAVNAATDAFQQAAGDKQQSKQLITALTGQQYADLSSEQRTQARNFLQDVGQNGLQDINAQAARVASAEDIAAGEVKGTAVDESVGGAALVDENGEDTVLLNSTLGQKAKNEVAREEVGEVFARRAAEAGITVAAGDAGARLTQALNGQAPTQASNPAAFTAQPGDRTQVVLNGGLSEAEAMRRPRPQRRPGGPNFAGFNNARAAADAQRRFDAVAFQMTPRALTSRVDSFRAALSVYESAILDLKNERFNAGGSSNNDLATNTFSEIDEGFSRSTEIIARAVSAGNTLRTSSEAVADFWRDRGGLGNQSASETVNGIYRHSLRDLYPNENGEVQRILRRLDGEGASAIRNVTNFLNSSRSQLETLFQVEGRDRGGAIFDGIMGSIGLAAGLMGAMSSFASNFGDIAAVGGERSRDLLGAFTSVTGLTNDVNTSRTNELALRRYAARLFPGADNANEALRAAYSRTESGKAALELADENYRFKTSLLVRDPNRWGGLVGEEWLNGIYSYRNSTGLRVFNDAKGLERALDNRNGDTTYRLTDSRNATGRGSFRSWVVTHQIPRTDPQTMTNNQVAQNNGAADIERRGRESFRDDPAFPGGGGGSDRRIKQDVAVVGHHAGLGVDVYAWRYRNDDPTRYVGVMAQDLLARPDLAHAVFDMHEGEFAGFKGVDYHALGLSMTTEDDWHRDGLKAITRH